MHPGQSLPPDTLAAIYIQLAPSQEFKLLGALGPEKQSAMYKVNTGKGQSQANNSIEGIPSVREETMVDNATEQPVGNGAAQDIVIGISIEPAAQVQAQLATKAQQQQPSTPDVTSAASGNILSGDTVKKLAQNIGQNAFNFLTGFAEVGIGGKEVVPIKAFQDWWQKFEKKVQLDPGFLMREGNG